VQFNGNSPSGAVFPDGGLPAAGAGFSVSFWVNTGDDDENWSGVSWGDVGGDAWVVVGALGGGGVPGALMLSTPASSWAATSSVASSSWVHCLVTFNASVVRFYVDGQPVGSAFASTNTVLAQGGFAQLCANQTVLLNGSLTDVRLFNTAVSADDALTLWNGGQVQTVNTVSGLIRWWPFSDGAGTTVTEVCAGANATLVGGSWSTSFPGSS
jgi:hypothetical protein